MATAAAVLSFGGHTGAAVERLRNAPLAPWPGPGVAALVLAAHPRLRFALRTGRCTPTSQRFGSAESGHNILLLRPVDVGKTHVANALRHIAIRRRLTVQVTRADRLSARLRAARLRLHVRARRTPSRCRPVAHTGCRSSWSPRPYNLCKHVNTMVVAHHTCLTDPDVAPTVPTVGGAGCSGMRAGVAGAGSDAHPASDRPRSRFLKMHALHMQAYGRR